MGFDKTKCIVCKCELDGFELEAIAELRGADKNPSQYYICDDCINCFMSEYGYYNNNVNFDLGDNITMSKREACCRFGM